MPADRDYLTGLLSLEGKVALVTGARTGIGAATALAMARAGARICLTSRRVGALAPVVDEARALGAEVLPLELELRDPAGAAVAVGRAVDHFGRLDILVNNAGLSVRGPADGYAVADWDAVVETNARGTFLMAQAAAEPMRRAGGGRIVNFSSTFAAVAAPGRAAYASSKAAVEQLTRVLAAEWAGDGITVNAVAPTTVLTESRASLFATPESRQRRVAEIPLGRLGVAAEVAAAVLFLVGPAGSFVTGHVLRVDGGFSLR